MIGLAALAGSPAVLSVVAASAGPDSFDPWALITGGLTPVAVVVLIVMGKLVPGSVNDANRQRAENAEASLATQNAYMADKVVPALTLATRVLDDLAPFVEAEMQIRTVRDQPGAPRLRDPRDRRDR